MSSLNTALKKFISNPKENSHKIFPYIQSKVKPHIRKFLEFLKIDLMSKPYSGHDDLLNEVKNKNGFYVVCGGNDGYGFDPTYFLERFLGWSGIIIEPLKEAAELCEFNRPKSKVVRAALVSNEYRLETIDLFDCNFMSLTDQSAYDINQWVSEGEKAQNIQMKKVTVKAKTLDAILEESNTKNKIDLLVIDVEGSEDSVLAGFNIKKYQPSYILIEIHNEDLKNKIDDKLSDLYKLVKIIGINDYLYKLVI